MLIPSVLLLGITEANVENAALEEALSDTHRIKFLLRHLYRIHNAIKNGVNVVGYMYWTLFDDFEWIDGYIPRFGFYYVDRKNNLNRIPKHSAHWYYNFLKGSNHSLSQSFSSINFNVVGDKLASIKDS
ncbi:hypothetical protein L6164_014834 [Bauhinia variegata]|uniref:Uncharacterized protein n=1 Tax=Bauhinia variegata TaxID=167791 RepID=A0ACB9NNH0_BAUVA|nr:hypothetical protein L6164_014834 [Bauhinia variegata]